MLEAYETDLQIGDANISSYIFGYGSYLIRNGLQKMKIDDMELFNHLKDEKDFYIDRNECYAKNRNQTLPRTNAYFYEPRYDGTIPFYSSPGSHYSATSRYETFDKHPVIAQLVNVFKELKINDMNEIGINHVTVTKYHDGGDNVKYHHDTLTSLEKDSYIIIIALGDTRDIDFVDEENNIWPITFNHGDIILLDAKTNKKWQYGFPQMPNIKMHLSIILRTIKTFIVNH